MKDKRDQIKLETLEAERQKAREEGIKEVVDWLEESENSWRNYYYLRFKITIEEWHAKLKEWKLEAKDAKG